MQAVEQDQAGVAADRHLLQFLCTVEEIPAAFRVDLVGLQFCHVPRRFPQP